MPAKKLIDLRKINRRTQIELLTKKGYFKNPKRAFTTKRIIWGNLDKVPVETLNGMYKIMKARIKTKKVLRTAVKEKKWELEKIPELIKNAAKRTGERIEKKSMEINMKDREALKKYTDFLETQQNKMNKLMKKIEAKQIKTRNSLKKTKKSFEVFNEKGKGDTIVINLGGVPVAFKINLQNLNAIEQKIWPQTRLDPKKIAIRRILIESPKKRIIRIQKILEIKGIKATENEINQVITEMINEKLIKRGPPQKQP